MPVLHARDCVCTICTCGKHECDIPKKKATRIPFAGNSVNKDSYAGAKSGRRRSLLRPKDHDVFGVKAATRAANSTEAREAWTPKEGVTKDKPLFAPKTRKERPHIPLNAETTAQAANKDASKPGRRASLARPKDHLGVENGSKFVGESANKEAFKKRPASSSGNKGFADDEFLATLARRKSRTQRPKVALAHETTSGVAFAKAPDRAARARQARPKDSLGTEKNKFEGKSRNNDDFNASVAKKGLIDREKEVAHRREAARVSVQRPRPHVPFQSDTTSTAAYREGKEKGGGHRPSLARPKTTVGEALRPASSKGKMVSEAQQAFVSQTLPPKRPTATLARRPKLAFTAETSNQAAYKPPTPSRQEHPFERAGRPRSALDKPQGPLASRKETVNGVTYTRPPSCPVPKLPPKPASANTGHTRYQRSESRGWF